MRGLLFRDVGSDPRSGTSPRRFSLFFLLALIPVGLALTDTAHARNGASAAEVDAISKFSKIANPTSSCPEDQKSWNSKGVLGELKNEAELEKYVTCYLVEPGGLEAYRKYESYIRAAANQFGIPRALFTCLLFRESRFNKSNVSSTGAKGLGQFTGDNINYISNIIGSGSMPPKKVQHFQSLVEKKRTSDLSTLPAIQQRRIRDDAAYGETVLSYVPLARSWNSYFDQLRAERRYGATAPTRFTRSMAYDPPAAIGASALYLRSVIDLFLKARRTMPGGDDPLSASEQHDLLIAAAGAYNLGHNDALKAIAASKSKKPSEWIKELSAEKKETADHIESIANCAKSSSKEKSSFLPMKGDDPWDCDVARRPWRTRASAATAKSSGKKKTTSPNSAKRPSSARKKEKK